MANIPSYDVRNLSFGPGILYVAEYDSTNDKPTIPTIDVGAVKTGSELRIGRDILDAVIGSPSTTIRSFSRSETVELTVTSIEWSFDNLKRALGSGVTDEAAGTYRFGGDTSLTSYSLKFVHETPDGDQWIIKLWKANPVGEITITFGDDLHEFNMTWRALHSSRTWGTAVTGEVVGSGDGTTTTFSGTLTKTPIDKSSVTVTDGTQTLTDDGNGNFTGDGSGTINYTTGAYSVTFTAAPDTGTDNITADYTYYETLTSTACLVEVEKIAA